MYSEFLARIIEPDTFLPSQYYRDRRLSRHLDGEKKLMLAVLKDAVECLDKYRSARSNIGKALYQSALEWVEERNTAWPFCFNNVCELLGFDPDYLRGFLLKRERAQSSKLISASL